MPKFKKPLWLLLRMVKKLLGKFYFLFVHAFFSVQLIKTGVTDILSPRHPGIVKQPLEQILFSA